MANIYNSQLDAFDLYHKIRELVEEEKSRAGHGSQLPPLGHALAGSTASALSNVFTYPLDLIITRLQTQQRDKLNSRQDENENVYDVVSKIYCREGGLSGFYAGLLPDTAKTIVDAFLFFLMYNFLRQKRLTRFAKTHGGRTPSLLPATDELGIGFIAGSLTKLVTAPIANVVTRKQTAATAAVCDPSAIRPVSAADEVDEKIAEKHPPNVATTRQIARDIYSSKGLLGFWSGYSASLILTLNPSLTFFLFEALKRVLLPRAKRDNPPPSATFLLAAISKAMASSITYPFSLAKARMQASSGRSRQSSDHGSSPSLITQSSKQGADTGSADMESSMSPSTTSKPSKSYYRERPRPAIISTLLTLIQTEGLTSVYEGLPLEILKGFLSHGLTMLLKQSIHNSVISLWFSLSQLLTSVQRSIWPETNDRKNIFLRFRERSKKRSRDYYDMAIDRAGEIAEKASEQATSLISSSSNTVSNGAVTATAKSREVIGESRELLRTSEGLMQDMMEMANETIELVRDYVEIDDEDE